MNNIDGILSRNFAMLKQEKASNEADNTDSVLQ